MFNDHYMKITAIRHTRVAVPPGICYGQTDVALAPTYGHELEQVKQKLNGATFDAVFCSPLTRCRQLAQDLFPGMVIQFDERLMELNFGQWEMQPWDTISETTEAQAWFADYVSVRTPGGESFRDLISRTGAFLDELQNNNETNVVVITHGGIVRALSCLLNRTAPLDAFQQRVDYGEVFEFTSAH
ncbi:alpha-ribazole phosphatase [Gaoshiqia sediminis]|uniref:Alpha-ribazole phosphatase n=1 Tax=Gaoshiqia sediminis TaxID=2986998 RepID=A0AA41Y159_9BACT|nr:alpha-ribazole phosphatase [Gaoshiqia sediminis]MCW0481566.1 alpha-ribazole phosphatase [Gaoshiqia sediminis]